MSLVQAKSITEQVEKLLRGRIRDGTYAPGSRMPSESELSEEFGVSRATLRTVLAKMAVIGLILRKQGDGTYVNIKAREINTHQGYLWEFVNIIETNGYKPTIKSIAVEKTFATEEQANAPVIEPGDELLSLTRLFYADDQPVILSKCVLPVTFLRVPIKQIDGNLPISEILKRYFRQSIAFAITDTYSVLVDKNIHNLLGLEAGQPILELKVAFYNRQNSPLALGSNFFVDAVLKLSLVHAWH